MAHAHKVLHSINDHGVCRCIDIFMRTDGSFGFEEYRRDPEDNRGWFSIGNFSRHQFEDEPSALAAALEAAPWLRAIQDATSTLVSRTFGMKTPDASA